MSFKFVFLLVAFASEDVDFLFEAADEGFR
jgi:hypothetical protein